MRNFLVRKDSHFLQILTTNLDSKSVFSSSKSKYFSLQKQRDQKGILKLQTIPTQKQQVFIFHSLLAFLPLLRSAKNMHIFKREKRRIQTGFKTSQNIVVLQDTMVLWVNVSNKNCLFDGQFRDEGLNFANSITLGDYIVPKKIIEKASLSDK